MHCFACAKLSAAITTVEYPRLVCQDVYYERLILLITCHEENYINSFTW